MTLRNLLYHPVSGKAYSFPLVVAALLPSLVFFPFPGSVFTNGIDPPLAWIFNFLIQGNLSLGKQIIFPHGPLAFLMYPLPVGGTFWVAIAIHLVARIFAAYSLLKLATRKSLVYMVVAFFSSCQVLAINDLLLTIVQIIVLCYLNYFERRNVTWLIPALIITAIALYIKAFVGIVSLTITFTFTIIMIYRAIVGIESWYRLLLILIVPFLVFVIWLLLYGNLYGIGGYFQGMFMLASDNSSAVAVYPLNNWWITGTAILAIVLLFTINLKNIAIFRFAILITPALFAIWKYGMAREDYLHTSVLFIFILFIVLVRTILSEKKWIVNGLLSLFTIVFFYITLQNSFYFEPYKVKFNGLQTLIKNVASNSYFTDTCQISSQKAISRNKLNEEIRKLIDNHTADVYPWDYTYLAANNLNWQPRPVIQSYASYTRELDQLNARHFSSKVAPDFIIWELRKITHDIHGGTLESIDGRYLLNDEPDALKTMITNYELVASQKGIFPALILKRRVEPLKAFSKAIQKNQSTWNTWIDVPDDTSGILIASADIQRNISGRIKSFLYKDEAVYLYYLLENGDIRMYRIVPKNASYGLWINPLLVCPDKNRRESVVRKIMFRCSDISMMKQEIGIEWSTLKFNQAKSDAKDRNQSYNLVYSFFGVTEKERNSGLIESKNDFEIASANWTEPDAEMIRVSNTNHALHVDPDGFSVAYEYNLDSLQTSNRDGEHIVRANVWANAEQRTKAVFVITIEKNGQSLLWKGIEIRNFIHDPHAMNFVTTYTILDKAILVQKGLVLKVYVWNIGKERILLDDFSVRIEEY